MIVKVIHVFFPKLHQEVFLTAVGEWRTETDFHRLAVSIQVIRENIRGVGHVLDETAVQLGGIHFGQRHNSASLCRPLV